MATQGTALGRRRRSRLLEPRANPSAELLHEARRQGAADERQRITRDLHDGVQQNLVTLGVRIELAHAFLHDPASLGLLLGEARTDLEQALAAIRTTVSGEAPAGLGREGLRAALEWSAIRAPVLIDVRCTDERFPAAVERCVYLCSSEAIQNVLRHAEARRGSVRVTRDGSRVKFEVSDDGKGFDPGLRQPGSGLRNLHDRVRELGGDVTVSSTPGKGTSICGWVPLTETGPPREEVHEHEGGGGHGH